MSGVNSAKLGEEWFASKNNSRTVTVILEIGTVLFMVFGGMSLTAMPLDWMTRGIEFGWFACLFSCLSVCMYVCRLYLWLLIYGSHSVHIKDVRSLGQHVRWYHCWWPSDLEPGDLYDPAGSCWCLVFHKHMLFLVFFLNWEVGVLPLRNCELKQ